MKKGIAKYTAFCLAAGFVFTQSGVPVLAAGSDLILVGIGSAPETQSVAGTVVDTTEAEGDVQETEKADPEAAAEPSDETEETEPETEEKQPVDKSMVGTTGFAQCEEYLNVRSDGSTEGDVVGKIYNNGSLEIIDVDDNGWYYVRSGNVEGYVAAQYVVTGEAAESIAATAGYTTAEVGAEVLNLRASASEDGEIIGAVYEADQVEVVEDQGDWVKVVASDGTYGYVSADYVYTSTSYATGETLEEEQARLDQEWLDYLAQQAAAQAAAEAAYAAQVAQQSYSEPSYNYGYSEAQAAADAAAYEAQAAADAAAATTYDAQSGAESAYQSYLDAQAAADAATAGADEQAVYDTAAAAQAAYEAYLSAQAEADAAAQAEADAAYAAQAAAEAAASVSEDAYYEDTTYTDDTYTDDTYTDEYEDSYTEDTYTEPSYSSVGQQVADFAVQFVGNPYVWGGSSLTNGADCSGFVMSVYANFGISLPHSAAAQSGYGTAVSADNLQPGDLLFYSDGSGIGHVSIYIGNGQVVHASSSTTGIIISSVGYRTPCAYRRLV